LSILLKIANYKMNELPRIDDKEYKCLEKISLECSDIYCLVISEDFQAIFCTSGSDVYTLYSGTDKDNPTKYKVQKFCKNNRTFDISELNLDYGYDYNSVDHKDISFKRLPPLKATLTFIPIEFLPEKELEENICEYCGREND